MVYILPVTIILLCLVAIIWCLRIYRENRLQEKQQRKYREDNDIRYFR